MRFVFLFAFFLGLLLFACKKGKSELVLSGNILDLTLGKNLSGAQVKLYEVSGSGAEKLISSTTASDGTFSFSFVRNQVDSYRLQAEREGYFTISESIPFGDLTKEHDNLRNFTTTAKAWVGLTFINQNPSTSDVLRYFLQEGKTGSEGCMPEGDQFLYGAVDTTLFFLNDGNEVFSYYYVVQGTGNQGVKFTNTPPFDTTYLVLNY